MRSRLTWAFVAACGVPLIIVACGGNNATTGPSPTTPPTTPPGAVNTLTITIADNLVTQKDIVVPLGSVTFVNNDNRAHDMEWTRIPSTRIVPRLHRWAF